MSNIKIEIPATDPQAQRIFADALLRYAEVNEERIRGFVEAQTKNNTGDVPTMEVSPETYEKIATGEITNVSIASRIDTDKYIGDVELPQSAQADQFRELFSHLTPEQSEANVTDVPPPPVTDVPPPPSADVPPPPPVTVTDLPWDERIHASSKVKNQDGSWKARRKPPTMTQEDWDIFVKDVEAELQVLMSMSPNTPTTAQPMSFAELMVKIKPHLVNPDFVARAKEICDGMNLPNGIADLSRNESLIPQFIEEIGLDD